MNIFKYIPFAFFLMISCSGTKEKNPMILTQPDEVNQNLVVLTKDQVATIKLKFGQIQQRSISNVIKANGYLDVPPQNKAVISPMITGYVRKVNFLVGDNVKKGQIMAELESMEFIDLQQQYIEIKARLEYLKDDFDRQKLLRDQDAISRKKYLMAEVDYKIAVSTLNGLKSKLKLLGLSFGELDKGQLASRILLRAPISGSVKVMNTVIGKHIDPSEELIEIVNPEHLHLELSVYENDVLKVKKGQEVLFTIPSILNTNFKGEVFLVGKDLSEDKRSINIHVHINDDEADFTVGMYANATIIAEENPSNTLPETAVVVDGNSAYIFKITERTINQFAFERIPIKTGIESNGYIEILDVDEISFEDEIVIQGAFYLLNAFAESEASH